METAAPFPENRADEISELSPWLSAAISLMFWGSLTIAAALYAALALAPRLSESLALQDRHINNAIQAHALTQELHHLELVANALKHDPDFVARVAAQERVGMDETFQIHVDDALNFDARVPSVKQMQPPQPPWYATSVHELATTSPLRYRWTLATLVLFSLSFVCLNDGFFSNKIGRTLVRTGHAFLRRYHTGS